MALTVGENPPSGMVGDQYYTELTATGGSPPYQWVTIVNSTVPSGLKLDSKKGTISGYPTFAAEGTTSFTVQVTDADEATAKRVFSLTINPALKISRYIELPPDAERPNYIAELHADGGAPPYRWALAGGSTLPAGLSLDPDTGTITGSPTSTGTTWFTVQATDDAGHADKADFSIKVRPTSLWHHPFERLRHHAAGHTKMACLSIKIRPPRRWPHPLARLGHISFWLAVFALGAPVNGAIWIFLYAFATPGSHLTYLGVAIITALAALSIGALVGFLFGIPRVVSSGQLRHEGTSAYSPSTNLAEVSDWLTKLLLGAGLVQLTRLGAPIGGLIDHVAAGLYDVQSSAGSSQAAKVVAGAILFGYGVIGLLDGYVVTTMWYQKKIADL